MTNANSKFLSSLQNLIVTDPSGFKVGKSPRRIYLSQHCHYNAFWNRKNYEPYKDFKPVWGSLLYKGKSLFGTKTFTFNQWKAHPDVAHCWLEDSNGGVYDYIFPIYKEHFASFNEPCDFPINWEVAGQTKKELLEMGWEYIPAPKLVQRIIFNDVRRSYDEERFDAMEQKRQAIGFEADRNIFNEYIFPK
jgi:hypothetical protein